MVRDDRSTYVGPFREDEEGFKGYRWFPRRDVLADNEAFVSVMSQNARVKAIAEQLLGLGEVEEIHSSSVRRSNCDHLAMPHTIPSYRHRHSCMV